MDMTERERLYQLHLFTRFNIEHSVVKLMEMPLWFVLKIVQSTKSLMASLPIFSFVKASDLLLYSKIMQGIRSRWQKPPLNSSNYFNISKKKNVWKTTKQQTIYDLKSYIILKEFFLIIYCTDEGDDVELLIFIFVVLFDLLKVLCQNFRK